MKNAGECLSDSKLFVLGTVVSVLTLGLCYQMFNKWVLHNGEDE